MVWLMGALGGLTVQALYCMPGMILVVEVPHRWEGGGGHCPVLGKCDTVCGVGLSRDLALGEPCSPQIGGQHDPPSARSLNKATVAHCDSVTRPWAPLQCRDSIEIKFNLNTSYDVELQQFGLCSTGN